MFLLVCVSAENDIFTMCVSVGLCQWLKRYLYNVCSVWSVVSAENDIFTMCVLLVCVSAETISLQCVFLLVCVSAENDIFTMCALCLWQC